MFPMSCRLSPGGRKGCCVGFSHHAVQRCIQRGIGAQQVEWLRNFGVRVWNYDAEVYLFDCDDFDCLLQSVCSQDRQLAEKSRYSYAVVSAGRRHYGRHRNTTFCLISRSALNSGVWIGFDFEGVQGESGTCALTAFPMQALRCRR